MGQNTPEKALTEAAAAITPNNAMNTEASAVSGKERNTEDSTADSKAGNAASTIAESAATSTVAESGAAGTAAETSSLAALKEAQTGEATHELTETEDKGFMDAVAQQMLDDSTTDAMQNLTASSVSKISFAKGESEKVIRFRILEDKESEGTEGFTLLLADPDGAELYQVGTAGITIEDDEKSIKSEVSFSGKEYQAKDGKVAFTVKRTGAEYSVCDMLLMTSEDTAVAGENYTEKCETLSFAPYETEKTVEMDVSGTGKFSVLLTELKACKEGEYTKAIITLPQENDVSNQESTAKTVKKSSDKGTNKKASDIEEQSFGITLNLTGMMCMYSSPMLAQNMILQE